MCDRDLKKFTLPPNKLWVAETSDGQICGIVTITKCDNNTFSLNKLSVRLSVANSLNSGNHDFDGNLNFSSKNINYNE